MEVDPISILTTATRDLMAGDSAGSEIADLPGRHGGPDGDLRPLTVRLYGRA